MLALLTPYPHPTFAPSSGELPQILKLFSTKVPWIWCRHLWIHHICKVCYSGTCSYLLGLIYVRFRLIVSQIFATLFLGYMMKKMGARRIFLLSAAVSSTFNTAFFSVDLLSTKKLFLAVSVILISLTSLGDAGIFCSNYVLAAQQSKELRKREDSDALGPAIIETMYAAGGVLGPLLGGGHLLLNMFNFFSRRVHLPSNWLEGSPYFHWLFWALPCSAFIFGIQESDRNGVNHIARFFN